MIVHSADGCARWCQESRGAHNQWPLAVTSLATGRTIRRGLLAVVVGFAVGPLAVFKCHCAAPIGYMGRIGEASNPGPTGPVHFSLDNPEADLISEAENDFPGAEHFHIGSGDSDHEMSGGDAWVPFKPSDTFRGGETGYYFSTCEFGTG